MEQSYTHPNHRYRPFLVESALAGVATLILILALRSPARSKKVHERPQEPSTSPTAPVHTYDILGGILLFFTVLVPLIGLNLWGNVLPGTHPVEITLLCLTFVLLGLFTYHELYHGKSALLPLHLLKNSQSLAVLACTGLTIFARNQVRTTRFRCRSYPMYERLLIHPF